MKKIGILILLFSVVAEAKMQTPLPGGVVEEESSTLIFSTPDSYEKFYIDTNSEDYTQFGPHEYFRQAPHLKYMHRLTGKTAKAIFIGLLMYLAENDPDSEKLIGYEGGIVLARGISCRHGRSLMRGHKFMCLFHTGDEFPSESFGGVFALPRPRMGSGNAYEMLSLLDIDLRQQTTTPKK